MSRLLLSAGTLFTLSYVDVVTVSLSPLPLLSARRQPPLIFLSSEYERNIKRGRLGGGLFARRIIGSLCVRLDRQTHQLLTFCGVSESQQNDSPQLPLDKVRWKIIFCTFYFLGWMVSHSFEFPVTPTEAKQLEVYYIILPTIFLSPNISHHFLKANANEVFFKSLFSNVDRMFPRQSAPNI